MAMRRDRVRADRRANIMEFRVYGTVAETELKLRLFSYGTMDIDRRKEFPTREDNRCHTRIQR